MIKKMDKTLLTVIIIGIIVLILSKRPRTLDTPVNKTEEIEECIKISEKCGKFLAKVGNFNMVMISLGVTV